MLVLGVEIYGQQEVYTSKYSRILESYNSFRNRVLFNFFKYAYGSTFTAVIFKGFWRFCSDFKFGCFDGYFFSKYFFVIFWTSIWCSRKKKYYVFGFIDVSFIFDFYLFCSEFHCPYNFKNISGNISGKSSCCCLCIYWWRIWRQFGWCCYRHLYKRKQHWWYGRQNHQRIYCWYVWLEILLLDNRHNWSVKFCIIFFFTA